MCSSQESVSYWCCPQQETWMLGRCLNFGIFIDTKKKEKKRMLTFGSHFLPNRNWTMPIEWKLLLTSDSKGYVVVSSYKDGKIWRLSWKRSGLALAFGMYDPCILSRTNSPFLVSLILLFLASAFSFLFFFAGDGKLNLSYTKGKGTGLRRSRDKSEETEPLTNQTGAQHTRLNFLGTSHRNVTFFVGAKVQTLTFHPTK